MDYAETIKQNVTIDALLNLYGIEINRSGFVCCPFHGERTPSMKIYRNTNTFHCFGCGESGDVISFVRKLYNLDFKQAVARISYEFRLDLTDARPDPQERRKIERERAEKAKALKLFAEKYNAIESACVALNRKRRMGGGLTPFEAFRLDFLENWLDNNREKVCGRG